MITVTVFNPGDGSRYEARIQPPALLKYRTYIASIGHVVEAEVGDDPDEVQRELDLQELRVSLPKIRVLR